MVIFPHCKINLGLNIVRKRDDGYHDLETVFLPIPLYDCVEVIRATEGKSSMPVAFSQSGNTIPGDPTQNLCYKACELLRTDYPDLPPITMHLHKTIPHGAGLGGGSADGAFTLRLLNAKFRLGVAVEKLNAYALQLGSDAPFFMQDRPCFASGRGEKLEPLELSFFGYSILLVNPGIAVSTPWAFGQVKPKQPDISIREIIGGPIEKWRSDLTNDFERPVFTAYPEIGQIKNKMYDAGAVYASMSGSGSTVYGIFKGEVPGVEFNSDYFVRAFSLAVDR